MKRIVLIALLISLICMCESSIPEMNKLLNHTFDPKYKFTFLQRFVRYVKIDTTSDPKSKTFPSTMKQLNLSRILVEEMKQIGIRDAHLDEHGYVMGTLESNSPKKNIPILGLISHVDTSDDVSGTNVRPVIHTFKGEDLKFNDRVVVKANENPELFNYMGQNIVTSDGTTLLGADDKAGIAEILDAMNYLVTHPEVKHGTIKIAFTPDEEIGMGMAYFDPKKFGATFAYTIDGGGLGEIETESFSADAMTFTFKGVNVHPGQAKGKLINSQKVASYFISLLPLDRLSPETTEKREGFVHPVGMEGSVEETTVDFIIRDFETPKLKEYEDFLNQLAAQAVAKFPGSSFSSEVREQYRNMREVLEKYPQIEKTAVKAMERLGIKPKKEAIRGGTDGSKLSFMGIPCPNMYAGGRNFHSTSEWIPVSDMENAVKTIVTMLRIWEEEAN
jgi:tripeptide aminopeptidase